MSDVTIPEDIRAAAVKCAETVCRNLDYDDCEIEITAIARAILAEREAMRERCAKIADACFADIKGYPHDFGALDTGGLRAAEKIAQAIRSPHPNDEGDGK